MASKHILVIEPHDPGGDEPPPATRIIPVPAKPTNAAETMDDRIAAAVAAAIDQIGKVDPAVAAPAAPALERR